MDERLTVGVLAPVGGGYFFGKLLAGVTRRIAAAGGQVIMLQSLDAGVSGDAVDDTDRPPPIRPVAWSHLDGVVVTVGAASSDDIRRLVDAGIPVVRACVELAGVAVPGVSGDNVGGTRDAVQHLLDHGHTRIGFAGNLHQSDMQQRFDTYRAALVSAGHPPDDDWFFEAADNTESGGAAVARRIVERGIPVTAMMFATDRNALGALAEFALLGVDVPRDLALIGFDGIEAGSFAHPLLATVNQHTIEVAEHAASLLIDRIAGNEVTAVTQVTPSTLVRRGSCGCGDGLGSVPATVHDLGRDGTLAAVLEACASLVDPSGLNELVSSTERLLDCLAQDADEAGDVGRSTSAFASFVGSLGDLAGDPETIRRIGGLLSRFVVARTTSTATGEVARASAFVVGDINAALWREFVRSSIDRRAHLELSLWEQYEVSVQLFEGDSNPTAHLDWLASTRVRAGSLAVWNGDPADGRLKLVAFYDRDQVLEPPTAVDIPIEQFPPRALIAAADHSLGEVTFVVPIRTGGRNWGMLALVNSIDSTTSTGREQHSQWASLLAGAFAQRAMHDQIAASEERYGLAARATNDGLWDWDIAGQLAYFSYRCNELLGVSEPAGLAPLEHWLERLHPDDREQFEHVLNAVSAGRLDAFDMEQRVDDGDGGYRRVLCRALPVGTVDGSAHRVVGSLADIEPQKRLEEQLRLGALYDEVTGLPNRRLFLDRLSDAITTSKVEANRSYAVVFLDLDEFKLVNDSLGHLVGDDLLVEIADRLKRIARAADTPARFGGDEFAVLLRDVTLDDIVSVVERMRRAIAAPMMLDGHEVHVTATFGIAEGNLGYTDPEEVLRNADIAMYRAKATERGSFVVFDVEMGAHALVELSLRAELRQAFERDQFEVHYQPIWSSSDDAPLHFEALVRWRRPGHGLQHPDDFLPVLIESGQMVRLGRWIIERVCTQLEQWREQFGHQVRASVNVSHPEFWNPDLPRHLLSSMQRHGISPSQLVIEITEDVIRGRTEDVSAVMAALRRTGVDLHVDDFGTGTSSLHALYDHPVQGVKIDRSFVSKVGTDPRMDAVVRAIIDMSRALDLEVIAEGVEQHHQFVFLREIGCDHLQGFALSPVLDEADATDFVMRAGGHRGRASLDRFGDAAQWPALARA